MKDVRKVCKLSPQSITDFVPIRFNSRNSWQILPPGRLRRDCPAPALSRSYGKGRLAYNSGFIGA